MKRWQLKTAEWMVISNEKTETNCFIIFINFKTADLLVEVLLPMLKEACIEDFLVFVNSYTNIDSNIDWDKAFFWRGSCPPPFFFAPPFKLLPIMEPKNIGT